MNPVLGVVLTAALLIVTGIVQGVIGNDAYALLPWLTGKIVRLSARIDADDPDEINDIFHEHMDRLNRQPGYVIPCCTAWGLLFKVAIARRVYDAALAAYCTVRCRTALRLGTVQRGAELPPGPEPTMTISVELALRWATLAELPVLHFASHGDLHSGNILLPDQKLVNVVNLCAAGREMVIVDLAKRKPELDADPPHLNGMP